MGLNMVRSNKISGQ